MSFRSCDRSLAHPVRGWFAVCHHAFQNLFEYADIDLDPEIAFVVELPRFELEVRLRLLLYWHAEISHSHIEPRFLTVDASAPHSCQLRFDAALRHQIHE